jgi:outer membrane lipoprotein carrier protein
VRTRFLSLSLLLLAVPILRETPIGLARAVDAHYRDAHTLAAVFLEKFTGGGAGLRVESGRVYFSQPGKMRWDYDSPEKKMFLVDGHNVWYYIPASHTASRALIKKSDDWRTPLALLAGKVKLEKICGKLAFADLGPDGQGFDPEERPTEEDNMVLVCMPRKEDESFFQKVLIEVNSRNQIIRIVLRQPGDVEIEYRFGDWKENIPIAETKFHFEPPAGVAIVDDRALTRFMQ